MANLGRMAIAALGILAYQNRDKLGDLLKGATGSGGANRGGTGGGILDGVLGGASGGLGDLLDRFRGAGKGDAVDSWVGKGENAPIEPEHVGAALDAETMEALIRQTGMTRDEIVRRLALNLPHAVDEMTPDGRLPDSEQTTRSEGLLDPVDGFDESPVQPGKRQA